MGLQTNILTMLVCAFVLSLGVACGEEESSKSKGASSKPAGPADEAVALFEKGCECKDLRKRGEKEDYERCKEESMEMAKEAQQTFKDLSPVERKEVAEAVTGLKCESSTSLPSKLAKGISLGSPVDDAEAMFNKACECKQLAKDKDKEGADACAKEAEAMAKEMKAKYKDMDEEEAAAFGKEVREAAKDWKCE